MQYPILAILLLARYSAAGILKKGTCNGFFLASPEVEQANDWDVIRRSQGGCPQYQYANAEQANPPSAAAEGVLYTCNCMNRDITADHQGTSQCCASSNGHLNAREACADLNDEASDSFSDCCPDLFVCVGMDWDGNPGLS